mmetsp:Transcript_3537/g.8521  ORF Transcript_3537/g.8521 Transcript_3537/m.8521 type:complete len:348 (-) Transcript_3537:24-1067(-)
MAATGLRRCKRLLRPLVAVGLLAAGCGGCFLHCRNQVAASRLPRIRQPHQSLRGATSQIPRKAVDEIMLGGAALALSSAAVWHGRNGGLIQGAAELFESLTESQKDSPPVPVPKFLEAASKRGQVMIGVTGASGAGKSSVVNALRSLRDSDKGAARTGITETTLTPEMYEWRLGYSSGGTSSSERGSLVTQEAEAIICDLPGIGTPRFPQASYLKSMGIRYFDLVLLITASRLTESELRLVAELKAYGVPHFLVRNKIDVDIEAELLNEEDEVEDPLEEQQLRHQVAKQTMDIVKQDLRALTGAKHVYCISTRRRCRRRHDFPKLVDDIKRAVAKHVPERPRELVGA